MIAGDASNFQKRHEITTGIAFRTEKTVTTAMMIIVITNVTTLKHLAVFAARDTKQARTVAVY